MMTVVLGGSGSGKSVYAENYIMECVASLTDMPIYYLATMQVFGEEGRKKVARHRELRKGKGFLTIERTTSVRDALGDIAAPQKSAALLECMSNLAANEMFREDCQVPEDEVVDKITADIQELKKHLAHLVIVTNNVFEDGIQYDSGTMAYLRALGKINGNLAQMADEVIEIVVGIPVMIKKGK